MYVKGATGLGGVVVGFGGVEGLAVGEEAAADRWAVLGGLAVAIEEVKFVGFGWWWRCLRRHFFRCIQRKAEYLSKLVYVAVGVGGENLTYGLVVDYRAGALTSQSVNSVN